ncbi:MAG: peptidase T [Solobacterium sp.]|jgi:tripeptide aminopeptidase|nr:peptidase T [Solobacterium sp.]MCH4282225.1 peptidase T [Solobacterium sp.]
MERLRQKKMSAEERLIRYCKVDTQSDPNNEGETPSTKKQFDLAKILEKELKDLGMENATLDEHCYVYAWLPANTEKKCRTVGFIAHMDTAPDFSGTNVKPRIIESFDGKDIVLNPEVTMKMSDFPQMRELKGKRLMVTDGSTLLGADDKAGVVSIMEALTYLHAHPEVKHGRIAVAFTPDEEIGNGPKYFDVQKFGADFAYTMDGGEIDEFSEETFNAASAEVEMHGFSIHPGDAKDRMINAASLACEFQEILPKHMTPEHTEGREGFIHLISIKGNTEEAELSYILRDHNAQLLEKKKELLQSAASYLNDLHGKKVCTVTIKDAYRNMYEVLKKEPEVRKIAWQSLQDLGIDPKDAPIRGGTDGAVLSFRGLPCPNLGNGGGNFHGRYEYCVMEELEQASQLILHIIQHTQEA